MCPYIATGSTDILSDFFEGGGGGGGGGGDAH